MGPCAVARELCCDLISCSPAVDIVDIVLFRPEHAGQRLAHYVGLVSANLRWNHRCIERIGFLPARFDDFVARFAVESTSVQRRERLAVGKPETDYSGTLRRDGKEVVCCGFGSTACRIDG